MVPAQATAKALKQTPELLFMRMAPTNQPWMEGLHDPTGKPLEVTDDLRKVLELYLRENGHYPDRLDQLVSDHWLTERELEVPGHRLVYHPKASGANYKIQLERDR